MIYFLFAISYVCCIKVELGAVKSCIHSNTIEISQCDSVFFVLFVYCRCMPMTTATPVLQTSKRTFPSTMARGPRQTLPQVHRWVHGEIRKLVDIQHEFRKHICSLSSTDLYLKLEDVTRRFQKPCIMDVKIGQRSYDPFASQEKREQQIRKYPLMEEIGFLVLGMRVCFLL